MSTEKQPFKELHYLDTTMRCALVASVVTIVMGLYLHRPTSPSYKSVGISEVSPKTSSTRSTVPPNIITFDDAKRMVDALQRNETSLMYVEDGDIRHLRMDTFVNWVHASGAAIQNSVVIAETPPLACPPLPPPTPPVYVHGNINPFAEMHIHH